VAKHSRQSIMDPLVRNQAKWNGMKIGIIGSGNMGRATWTRRPTRTARQS
jgi:predicted homoserine dehydrogenase-like protein